MAILPGEPARDHDCRLRVGEEAPRAGRWMVTWWQVVWIQVRMWQAGAHPLRPSLFPATGTACLWMMGMLV